MTSQYHAEILDSEIEQLNTQFPKISESITFTDKWKEVKERLEVLNKEIIMKKQGKFVQDKLAFTEGFTYKWGGKQRPRRFNTRQRAFKETTSVTDLTESDSSISSLSSQVAPSSTKSRAPGIPRKRSLTDEDHPTKELKKGKKHSKSKKPTHPSCPGTQASGSNTQQSTLHNIIPKVPHTNPQTLFPNLGFLAQPTPEPSRRGSLDVCVLKTPMPNTAPNLTS